ncbi:MAG: PepSY-associated TM helix domain-containing protein [Pseudomonadota bacterium]
MSFVTQAKTKRLLAVHGWSGTILGLLLYVVIFTGAIVVFADEIGAWSRGALGAESGLGPQVDHRFRVAARTVDRNYYEDVSIGRTRTGDFSYTFEGHEIDPSTGEEVDALVRLRVDPESGEVLERWEGLESDLPRDSTNALSRFWVDLHEELYLPAPYGFFLVCVLGMMMMFAAVSGVLIHKHVVRDAFVAARNPTRLVGARDLHVLAGTWGIPFAILLALTGAFLGFAFSVGVPVMAMIAFEGDQQAMIETLVARPEAGVDLTPAPLAALDFVIRDAMERTGATVSSIQISNFDSVGATISVIMGPAPGGFSGQRLEFDGVTRAFEGVQPGFGTAHSLSSTLFGIIRPLHFGDFAGLGSKTVWFGMGLAMAYVNATGMLLWCKRREDQALWRSFRHWIMVTIFGLPFAMLVSAVAYFVTVPVADAHFWTPVGFLVGLFLCIALGLKSENAGNKLRLANAVLCLALPVLRHLMGGTSWSESLISGGAEILVIDILLLAMGLLLLRKARARSIDTEPPSLGTVREPAE